MPHRFHTSVDARCTCDAHEKLVVLVVLAVSTGFHYTVKSSLLVSLQKMTLRLIEKYTSKAQAADKAVRKMVALRVLQIVAHFGLLCENDALS